MRVLSPSRHLAPLLLASLLGSPALAVEMTLFPVTDQPTGKYTEMSGSWQDAGAQSLAVGPGTAPARLSIAADGKLTAVAEFAPSVLTPGEYRLEIAWPPAANAKNVTVTVSGQAGFMKVLENVTFDGVQSGNYAPLITMPLAPGQPLSIKVDGTTSTGPASESQPWALGIGALRLSTVTTAVDDPFAAGTASAAAPISDPFSSPGTAATDSNSPFTTPGEVGDGSADPFAAPAQPAAPASLPSDPFAAPDVVSTTTTTDPFAAPASAGVNDPFAAPGSAAGANTDPFGSAPAQPATASSAGVSDPFAAPGAATGANTDPFAPPPSQPAQPATAAASAGDPFAAPSATTDPFGSAPAQPAAADPFAPTTTTTAAAASDPFSAPPAQNDPFAAPAAGAASTLADPFSSPGTVGDGAPSDPFGSPSSPATASATDASGQPANPFAPSQVPAPDSNNPFAPGAPTPSTQVSDPFAAPSGSETQDPFGQPAPTTAVPTPAAITIAAPTPVPTPNPLTSYQAETVVEGVTIPYGTNLATALSEARKARRPVFVLFSGDTQAAVAFEKTLSNPQIAKVLNDFALVRVNYRENRDLARKYAVSSFPYVVVINRHGYTEGHMGPSKNVDSIRQTLISYTQQLF